MSAANPACGASELLMRRLASFWPLKSEDVAPLARLDTEDHGHAVGSEIALASGETRLVTAGLIAEARLLSDGRRQIVSLRLPGDLLSPAHGPSHLVSVLAPSRTVDASSVLRDLEDARRHPALYAAWLEARRLEQRILLDHVVRLGRLSAYERTAHLVLELHERLLRVRLAKGSGFQLPLTQEMMADLLGLSIVHVNRTLQQLRRDGLLTYRSGSIGLPNRESLADAAGYALQLPLPPPDGVHRRAL